MKIKTINISVPTAMAEYIEREVAEGQYTSTSGFFRTLVHEHQAANAQDWIDAQVKERLSSAGDEKNHVPHEDLEREILGQE